MTDALYGEPIEQHVGTLLHHKEHPYIILHSWWGAKGLKKKYLPELISTRYKLR